MNPGGVRGTNRQAGKALAALNAINDDPVNPTAHG
jgi:hypothetical protein